MFHFFSHVWQNTTVPQCAFLTLGLGIWPSLLNLWLSPNPVIKWINPTQLHHDSSIKPSFYWLATSKLTFVIVNDLEELPSRRQTSDRALKSFNESKMPSSLKFAAGTEASDNGLICVCLECQKIISDCSGFELIYFKVNCFLIPA